MLLSALLAAPAVTIDPETRTFRAADGRQVTLHGVNMVRKEAPYFVNTTGPFDYNMSVVDEDIAFLRRHGFNLVRLGVMWPGVYPAQGEVNETYLDLVEELVNKLGEAGIYSLLDMHQDVLSAFMCGEGIPDWAVPVEVPGVAAFPIPVTDTAYERDENGYIDRETCLEKTFASYYNSEQTQTIYECLFTAGCNPFQNPTDPDAAPEKELVLQDELKNFWTTVASRFAASPYVLGYDLINEPVNANKIAHPEYKNSTLFDEAVLQPFYQEVMKAIYAVDSEHVLFFEPTVTEFAKPGFAVGGPGTAVGIPSELQSYAWHLYCMTIDENGEPVMPEGLCKVVDDVWYKLRHQYGRDMNVTPIINEFGALPDTEDVAFTLKHELSLMSGDAYSWAYWAYKSFGDITTAFDEVEGLNEGLFNQNGSVQHNKVKYLSHPYPQFTAGTQQSATFDFDAETLTLEYTTSGVGQATEIQLGEYWYGFGRSAKITEGAEAVEVVREEKTIRIVNLLDGASVKMALQ